MSEDGAKAATRQPSTVRIEAFSDGIIAIVATIMVLELHVPALTFMTGDFWTVFEELGPDLFVYALSFFVVAILLVNHHVIIRAVPGATTALYWWNANFLFWMALIPLSTSVYGKHPLTPLAAAFYGLVLFANTASLMLLRRCALSIAGAENGQEAQEARRYVSKDAVFATLYALSVPLAFISEFVSMAVIFIVAPAAYFLPTFVLGRR